MQNDIVEQNKEIISVGELNRSAKYLLEDAFANIAVIGEISNMSRPSSGHIYFTLKDEDGAILRYLPESYLILPNGNQAPQSRT